MRIKFVKLGNDLTDELVPFPVLGVVGCSILSKCRDKRPAPVGVGQSKVRVLRQGLDPIKHVGKVSKRLNGEPFVEDKCIAVGIIEKRAFLMQIVITTKLVQTSTTHMFN